jgi:hypothetical protein
VSVAASRMNGFSPVRITRFGSAVDTGCILPWISVEGNC